MFARGFKSWCETAATQQRRLLKLHPSDPLDPRALAQSLGIQVWTPEQVPGFDRKHLDRVRADRDGWSAVTLCMGAAHLIILNSSHRGGRPASDLAHELSHILLGYEPTRVDISKDGFLVLNTHDKQQEAEAAWLAGCLLFPREALVLIRRKGLDEQVAARMYGASRDMLEYRLRMSGVDKQLRWARRA